MPQTGSQGYTFSLPTKTQLVKLRSKALRAGVWFRALPRIDRVLVDLTIRVARSIRGATLAKNILAVIKKLEGLVENGVLRAFRGVASTQAQKLSIVAQKWGYNSAKSWASEVSFITFLANFKDGTT